MSHKALTAYANVVSEDCYPFVVGGGGKIRKLKYIHWYTLFKKKLLQHVRTLEVQTAMPGPRSRPTPNAVPVACKSDEVQGDE